GPDAPPPGHRRPPPARGRRPGRRCPLPIPPSPPPRSGRRSSGGRPRRAGERRTRPRPAQRLPSALVSRTRGDARSAQWTEPASVAVAQRRISDDSVAAGAELRIRRSLSPDYEDQRDASGQQPYPEDQAAAKAEDVVGSGDDQERDSPYGTEHDRLARVAERRQGELLLAIDPVDQPGDRRQEHQGERGENGRGGSSASGQEVDRRRQRQDDRDVPDRLHWDPDSRWVLRLHESARM